MSMYSNIRSILLIELNVKLMEFSPVFIDFLLKISFGLQNITKRIWMDIMVVVGLTRKA